MSEALPLALYTCFVHVKGKKNEIFICDFILSLKNKIRAITDLEYMCSVFNFVQYR